MRQLKITNSITSRESKSLEKYLQEIGKIKMITAEEEIQLAVLIRQGNQDAVDRLVKANLRFVVSVAKRYERQGLPLSDLIDEGNIGLIEAAKRFDETKGFKFISYAVWWIRQNILQAIGEKAKTIRQPINNLALNRQINIGMVTLEQDLERTPTADELADFIQMDVIELERSLLANQRVESLDHPLTDNEGETLLDVLADKDAVSPDDNIFRNLSLKTELDRCMETLSTRQKEVLCYFFGIGIEYPMDLDSIAEKFHLTRERIRQIKEKAIGKLRGTQQFKLLKSFLLA